MKHRSKVAIMTFHVAHNYGAMLQAYALQKAICKLGFDCEVLDYRFKYIDQWSGMRSRHDLEEEYGIIGGNLRFLHRYVKGYYRNISPIRRKFNRFMRKDIKLSKKVYFTPDSLQNAKYDVVVFGSDQIWNPELTNGPALEYAGKYFDCSRIRFVSYAASCGKAAIDEKYKADFLPLLKKFYAISLREESFTEFLKTEWNLSAVTVLDPVFLLNYEDWLEVGKKSEIEIEKPYLLIYAFQTDDDIYDVARAVACEYGLQLVSISYKYEERLSDIIQLTECGPKDFLTLVYRAAFVCTSSFHGMAFSILFEKDFYCMGHPLYSQRNYDLLKMVGLEERLFYKKTDIHSIKRCDYLHVAERLEVEKKKSLEFLRGSISHR